MYLHFLTKIRWVTFIFAGLVGVMGVYAMLMGNMRGLAPVIFAAALVGFQVVVDRQNKKSDVDPRDTIS
jgi:hypothetical protein